MKVQTALSMEPPIRPGPDPSAQEPVRHGDRFASLYEEHFDFVWRSARRLGIPEASADDAVQDVFLVVHRRLGEFEGRSSLKTWLFGITLRVVRDHRRRARRKGTDGPVPETVADESRPSPLEAAAQAEAARTLDRLLDEMDDDKRAVFVLAELEQMTAPEIGQALGANTNTVYWRLREARREFEAALARLGAEDGWRQR